MDWKTRIKNPIFWFGLFGVVMSPILAYNGLEYSDLTTWNTVGDVLIGFIKNPYLIGSVIASIAGFVGVAVNTSTPGFKD